MTKIMNIVKICAVVCGAAILATAFAACGGDDKEPVSQKKTHDPVTLEVTGKPGTYEAHNFVDGKCTMCDETTIFTQDSVGKADIVTKECDQKGTITRIEYTTDAYKDSDWQYVGEDGLVTKHAYVYTPYGYDSADKSIKYDVLYLMHGMTLNEDYWFAMGKEEEGSQFYQTAGVYQGFNGTANLLDTMMKNGTAKKAIIVTPTFYLPGEDGKTLSTDESMNAGVAGIGDELVNDLMPKIAKEYNTYAQVAADADAVTVDAALKANRAHQGYAGLSMGSAISFTTIWTSCLDYFAYIGSYSGATTVENAQQIANAANTTYKNDKIGYWYVGLGTIEKDGMDYPGDPLGCYRTMLAGIDGLQSGSDLSAGDNCQFVKCNNTGHNYQSWITALYNSMMVFFQADIA